jgi:2,3-bisphosphoglycerate-independent phosphoglycerate mutase
LEPVNFTWNIINDSDVLFHLNYRSDRAVQLTKAFFKENLDFEKKEIWNLYICTMTKYYKEYKWNIFIKQNEILNTLWEVLSKNNISQLHLAETEKFAHVTKFFNWWKQIVYNWENDILIPSPKVLTYDLKPEMSAYEIFETYKKEYNNYDFTVINFANWDMVGHTGNMKATIKTVETLDKIVWNLIKLSKENNIDYYITADHWNCETMIDKNWEVVTSHTTNKVPFWYINNWKNIELKSKTWTLADIAPTILNNFWIEIPKEMSGNVLK